MTVLKLKTLNELISENKDLFSKILLTPNSSSYKDYYNTLRIYNLYNLKHKKLDYSYFKTLAKEEPGLIPSKTFSLTNSIELFCLLKDDLVYVDNSSSLVTLNAKYFGAILSINKEIIGNNFKRNMRKDVILEGKTFRAFIKNLPKNEVDNLFDKLIGSKETNAVKFLIKNCNTYNEEWTDKLINSSNGSLRAIGVSKKDEISKELFFKLLDDKSYQVIIELIKKVDPKYYPYIMASDKFENKEVEDALRKFIRK